jgi:hypothetical protein
MRTVKAIRAARRRAAGFRRSRFVKRPNARLDRLMACLSLTIRLL